MKKTVKYKKLDVHIEVKINGVNPPPPAYQDTAPRHIILGTIPEWGWVERRQVSDLHLSSEVDKVEQEAKDFIDEKTKKLPAKVNVKTAEHIDKLSAKGFS
jgi:hypothetical protein